MTSLLLIRHGSTGAVDHRLAGRAPGVHLDETGARQARALAARLAELPIAAVLSSPMERALETAAPIAERLGLEVQRRPALDEIDFGEWTGRTFAELAALPRWRRFNSARSLTRIPGGEHFAEVQARIAGELERICATHPGAIVAAVSHADVIRAALAYLAPVPIDLLLRFEISPASVSAVRLSEDGPRIACLNHTDSLID